MCGIVGRYNLNQEEVKKENVENMLKTIVHRGPDHGDLWIKDKIGLGHRLLKIQDLSKKSFQPYKYKNLVMVYNGEIYNYKELRKKLKKENIEFNTIGDIEVLIKCFEHWGIEETLKKLKGVIQLHCISRMKIHYI